MWVSNHPHMLGCLNLRGFKEIPSLTGISPANLVAILPLCCSISIPNNLDMGSSDTFAPGPNRTPLSGGGGDARFLGASLEVGKAPGITPLLEFDCELPGQSLPICRPSCSDSSICNCRASCSSKSVCDLAFCWVAATVLLGLTDG